MIHNGVAQRKKRCRGKRFSEDVCHVRGSRHERHGEDMVLDKIADVEMYRAAASAGTAAGVSVGSVRMNVSMSQGFVNDRFVTLLM